MFRRAAFIVVCLVGTAVACGGGSGSPGDGGEGEEGDGQAGADDGTDDDAWPFPPQCLDGRVDEGEECDELDWVRGDGCDPGCVFSCHSDRDCNDGDPCTVDRCVAGGSGRLCTNEPAAGAVCDDDDPCTPPGNCDETGACITWPYPPPGMAVPLSPPNGLRTGSPWAPPDHGILRPILRWLACGDATGVASYDVQVDDSCTPSGFADCAFASPEASTTGIAETTWRPATDLPIDTTQPVGRRYYWRVRLCRGPSCSDWSAPRYVDVGRVLGDLNGDGYGDLVVGAPASSLWRVSGKVYAFMGDAAGLVDAPTSAILWSEPEEGTAAFGWSLTTSADMNGDGFADLAVSGGARVSIYLGSPTGTGAAPVEILRPRVASTAFAGPRDFGRSAAACGDVGADGYDDLVVADPCEAVHVFSGAASGVDPEAPQRVWRDSEEWDPYCSHGYGKTLALTGDLDSDGFADLAVGAAGSAMLDGPSTEGRVHVFRGGREGILTGRRTILADFPGYDEPGWGDEGFGTSLVGIRDVDGDGRGDLAVSAPDDEMPGFLPPDDVVANVYLFAGGVHGVDSSSRLRLPRPSGSRAGTALASGDFDGDGDPDLVVGAPNAGGTFVGPGAIYLYRASAGAYPDVPDAELAPPDGDPVQPFGEVLSVGDWDGDGHAELAVGAYESSQETVRDVGRVLLYDGDESGLPIVPVGVLHDPAGSEGDHFGQALP